MDVHNIELTIHIIDHLSDLLSTPRHHLYVYFPLKSYSPSILISDHQLSSKFSIPQQLLSINFSLLQSNAVLFNDNSNFIINNFKFIKIIKFVTTFITVIIVKVVVITAIVFILLILSPTSNLVIVARVVIANYLACFKLFVKEEFIKNAVIKVQFHATIMA